MWFLYSPSANFIQIPYFFFLVKVDFLLQALKHTDYYFELSETWFIEITQKFLLKIFEEEVGAIA